MLFFFRELLLQKGAFSEFMELHNKDLDRSEEVNADSSESNNFKMSEKQSVTVATDANTQLIDSEEVATGSVGFPVYFRYFRSIGVVLCITAVLTNAIYQAASVYASSESLKFSLCWQ